MMTFLRRLYHFLPEIWYEPDCGKNAVDPVTLRGKIPIDLKGGHPWALWGSSDTGAAWHCEI